MIDWIWNNQFFNENDLSGEPDPFDPRYLNTKYEAFYIALSDRWSLDVMVDPIDYEYLKQWKWTQTYGSGSRTIGWEQRVGKEKIYARRTVGKQCLWLHRIVCERTHGPAPSPYHVADHLTSDTMDCRRANLRWATLSQNSKNKFGSAWLQQRLSFMDVE